MSDQPQRHIIVSGIVSHRDYQPYIQILVGGRMVQLSMAQARSVAQDIQTQCARTEADAMIHKFFSTMEYPEGANAAIMIAFREFRSQLDAGTGGEVGDGSRCLKTLTANL